jgi:hypothetical protein
MTEDIQPPAFIEIMQTVFPVVATVPGHSDELARPDFFGTAFCVRRDVFMTAEHVYRAAAAHGDVSLGGPSEAPMMGGARVQSVECWPDRDIAVLYCQAGVVTELDTWLATRAQLLTDLSSFGYPHAVTRAHDRDHFEIVFRGYKGYVITIRGFDRLPNKPAVYEISCPFPEGLSGGPVMLEHEGRIVVAGVVIGSETVTYGGVDQTVGIAMIADEIVSLTSERLGGPLGAALRLNAAVVQHGQPPPAPG